MKKICFILSDSNTKGSNGAFIELIDSLDRNKFNLYVMLPSKGPMVHELEIRNIPLKVLYYKWWMREQGSPKWKKIARIIVNFITLPAVCYQILKWRCDIIYTNTIVIGIGLFSAIILRKTHIFHPHELVYEHHKLIFDFGRTVSLRIANKFTKYFICNSYFTAKKYSRFIEKNKIKVVYQSITISNEKLSEKIPTVKKHKFQCVIVGRLFENKGQIDAIDAINILIKKEHLDVGLWIIGNNNQRYEKYLKEIVKKNDIEKFVVFLGWLDNPFPLVKKADIALMCSKSEGFGRTTVEAMLLEKPVIGARSGATIELIKDKFNGLFYEFGNSEDLAEKIKFCYENPYLVDQMGKNAKKWANKKFTQKYYGEKIAVFLE